MTKQNKHTLCLLGTLVMLITAQSEHSVLYILYLLDYAFLFVFQAWRYFQIFQEINGIFCFRYRGDLYAGKQ